jgi:hypothetical protein
MRRKMTVFGLAMVIALLVTALAGTAAFAQGPYGSGAGFVDADGDGVCDNCTGTGVPALDGTGFQWGRSAAGTGGYGAGAGFVDADGDGLCDYGGGTGVPVLDGTGSQWDRAGGRVC